MTRGTSFGTLTGAVVERLEAVEQGIRRRMVGGGQSQNA
jgi:hypothetical protein